MAQLGNVQPGLPSPSGHSASSLEAWAVAMTRALTQLLGPMMHDLNQQPRCPEFTVATIPAAGDWKGRIIFVSDGAAGAKFQGSTGAAWVNLG